MADRAVLIPADESSNPKIRIMNSRPNLIAVDKRFALRDDLSLEAKGLLISMLAIPTELMEDVNSLPFLVGEKVEKVATAFQELMDKRYLRITQNDDGTIDHLMNMTPFPEEVES